MTEPVDGKGSYVVLRYARRGELEGDDRPVWDEALDGPVRANDAADAIRQAALSKTAADGTYVAVPARSWKPVKVEAVQTTVLKLEPT